MNHHESVERIPPQRIDVERTVIGTFLVKPSLLASYIDNIPESAFYSAANRIIFNHLVTMFKKEIPIDVVTLTEELRKTEHLEAVGDVMYINEVCEYICTSGNIPEYLKILIEKDIYRETITECYNISGISFEENVPPEELIARFESLQAKIEKKCDLFNIKRKKSGTVNRFGDFKDRVRKYKEEGFQNIGVSPGLKWKKLTEHYKPAKGMLNIFTGVPGHGKSEFVDALMINLAIEKNWKWSIFTPENYPVELYAQKLQEKLVGRRFFDFTEEEFERSFDFIHDHFFLPEPDEDNINVDSILKLYLESIENNGIDGCILDPWNELTTVPEGNETLTAYIGRKLGKIRRFARAHNVYMGIVAHPTKIYRDPKTKLYLVPRLYDISDSANWFNKADNGITIYRNMITNKTDVHIQKIKFKVHGKIGCVSFDYDTISGRYTEYDDTAFTNEQEQQPDLFYQK